MTRIAEHLDFTPGLGGFVCGGCGHIEHYMVGRPLCLAWDRVLKRNRDGKPLKCAECLVKEHEEGGND